MLILILFDRKAIQDQAIFPIGDKSLEQNDQAVIFVNTLLSQNFQNTLEQYYNELRLISHQTT